MLALSTIMVVGAFSMIGCSKTTDTTKNEDTFKVTLVLTEGGVNDGSFNQSAWEGAMEAATNFDVEVNYLECNQ